MGVRAATIWVILAAALGVVALMFRPSTDDTGTSSFTLGVDQAGVVSVEVDRGDGWVERVVRVPGADRWIVESERDGRLSRWPASDATVRAGLRTLASASLRARTDAADGGDEPAGVARLTIEHRGGAVTRVRIGEDAIAGRVPVVVGSGESSRAAWADRSLREAFVATGLSAWRDRRLGVEASSASSLSVLVGEDQSTVQRSRGRWFLRAPVTIDAEADVVERALAALAELRIERFHDRAEPEDPAFGLAEPGAVLMLGWESASESEQAAPELLIDIGGPGDAGVVFARVTWTLAGERFGPAVVSLEAQSLNSVAASPSVYLRRRSSTLTVSDLRGLRLLDPAGGTARELERGVDGWTVDGEPDRDEAGMAVAQLLCARGANGAELLEAETIEQTLGPSHGILAVLVGSGVEAERFGVLLPTAQRPELILLGTELENGRRAAWSYRGEDADAVVDLLADSLGI